MGSSRSQETGGLTHPVRSRGLFFLPRPRFPPCPHLANLGSSCRACLLGHYPRPPHPPLEVSTGLSTGPCAHQFQVLWGGWGD